MRIWLDVDTGIDDMLALLYAAASEEAEIVGVSCSAGNVEVDLVARNTAAVLALAGRPDVPVHVGRRGPIARALTTTPETHGPEGLGHASVADVPVRDPDPVDAVEALVAAARTLPGELHLITLGPLTNIAAAVLLDPDLPSRLAGMHVMGGCFTGGGNTAPRAEWNMHVDPEAAQVVLHAWGSGLAEDRLPLIMGLDVTERARLLPEHVARLIGAEPGAGDGDPAWPMRSPAPTRAAQVVVDALRFYFEFHAEYDGFYGAFVHDPFVVAAALDPALVRAAPVTVDIETGSRLTTAETVADWRGHWGRPPNARVAVAGDADAFLARLIERVPALLRG